MASFFNDFKINIFHQKYTILNKGNLQNGIFKGLLHSCTSALQSMIERTQYEVEKRTKFLLDIRDHFIT